MSEDAYVKLYGYSKSRPAALLGHQPTTAIDILATGMGANRTRSCSCHVKPLSELKHSENRPSNGKVTPFSVPVYVTAEQSVKRVDG